MTDRHTHEDDYRANNPKPDSNENGELFEWYQGLITALCADVNALPPEEREVAARIVRTGIAARRMNRGDFRA